MTARISIEEASTLGWDRYVGAEGTTIGMHTFGSSAPLKDVLGEVRLHARRRWSRRPRSCSTERKRQMKPTQELHDLGQSLWVDNITRTMLDDGTLAALHRRALGHRPDLEPDDLRQGDRRRQRLRRAGRRALRAGPRGRGALLRARAHRPAPRGGAVQAGPRPHRRVDGRVSLEVSPKLADDAQATIKQAAELYGRAEENFFIKIPGTMAGAQGDRGDDLRRDPRQRHAAVLDRAVPRRRRRLHARGRAADRGRASTPTSRRSPRSSSAAGTPPSPTRPRTSCATSSASRSASAPTPPTASCSTPTACCACTTRARRPQRLLWASTGTKDPDASDVLYIEGLASPVHGQHDAREDAQGVRRPRQGRRAAAASTAATPRRR